MTQRVWVLDYNGRLGNQLRLLTHLTAAALEYRFSLSCPAFWRYAHGFLAWQRNCLDFFPGNSPLFIPPAGMRMVRGITLQLARRLPQGQTWIDWLRCADHETIELTSSSFQNKLRNGPRHLFLWGYNFQGAGLVVTHAASLRKMFRPARMPGTASSEFRVALHVRRGDYRNFSGGRFFYSLDDYRRWIRAIQRGWRDQKPRVLVFSDDESAAELGTEFGTWVQHGSAVEDLFAMASCRLIVGPPSSFSDWAAWYGSAGRLRLTDVSQEPDPKMVTPVEAP